MNSATVFLTTAPTLHERPTPIVLAVDDDVSVKRVAHAVIEVAGC